MVGIFVTVFSFPYLEGPHIQPLGNWEPCGPLEGRAEAR